MGMYKNLLLFYSFLILRVLASPSINSTTKTPIKMRPTQQSTTGNNMTDKTKQEILSDHAASTSNTAPSKNLTILNSTNDTNSVTEQNLTVPSPTAQSTTIKKTTTATKTSLPTNSPGLTEMDVTARTPSLTDATGHSGNDSTSNSTSVYFTTGTTLDNKTSNETAGAGLTHSEKSLTIMFSVVLGVIVLLVFGQILYRVTKSKQRRVQYSHHPLFNENTGEQFMVQDDTLVISGGLYDGPQIYNSTVTAINDDQQTFAYTPTQFRLELLNEDPGTEQTYKAFTFQTFNNIEQEPQ